ncbi:ATP-binding protein [Marivirga salinae]|uniref:histidine kinase n=1 Tax=Marivirga salinarum TaxID=3059078 RepID=A0AA49GCV3_9BACT|nr:ATP-binding protein [Marivirga sp. BDSF4-3]WKK73596.2 ATP-binding protein [Marivirga sp. BDSF4-3]
MEKWQNPEMISKWILIVLFFLSFLILFIVLLVRFIYRKIAATKIAEAKAKTAHQKDLLQSTITTQEKERKRIATEIHDALIGKLLAVQIKAEQEFKDNHSIAVLMEDSISLARRISHDLSPPLMELSTLQELIQETIAPLQAKFEFKTKLDIRKQFEYTVDFKIQFIRIIQETLTNIIKHAQATCIFLHLRQSDNHLILRIKDNGIGFDSKLHKRGLGLKNIETRVQYLKGDYRINSRINRGSCSMFLFHHFKQNQLE